MVERPAQQGNQGGAFVVVEVDGRHGQELHDRHSNIPPRLASHSPVNTGSSSISGSQANQTARRANAVTGEPGHSQWKPCAIAARRLAKPPSMIPKSQR